ncbi:DNA replication terminus site-binding protein [Motiliproteus sediminis]|uniref:DNA replication terminus site-binding protein n=1 Tax=Motiliproteus sediminis TaxID=1468178 RepID=UPI001AF02709|nr:DNA replication terminus site-binding protein [Motiliproteus sediminis]
MTGFPHSDLVTAYDQLTAALARFANALHHSDHSLWVPLTDAEVAAGIDPRSKAIALYCNLWHSGDGDGRRTESRHGLVAIDDSLVPQVQEINAAKRHFQQATRPFSQQQAAWRKHLQTRGAELRDALATKGLTRLHLKQCYRQLPLVERQPEHVGFNWYSSGRSIKRVSLGAAQDALCKMGGDKPHIALQLKQLGQLPPDTPLAQVQQQAPLMRCNLRFATAPERQALNLSLPLLYVAHPGQPLPSHNEPPLTPPEGRQRRIRSDCRLEEEPFLPSLRIHRYQEGP